MIPLSVRRLWTLHRQVATEHGGHSQWELVLLQDAFYSALREVNSWQRSNNRRRGR